MSFIHIFQQWFKKTRENNQDDHAINKPEINQITPEEGQLIQLYATAQEGKSFDKEPESYDEALKLLSEVRDLKIDLTGVNWESIDFSDIHHKKTAQETDRLAKAKKIISQSYIA